MYNIIQGSRTDKSPPFLVNLVTDPVTLRPFDLTGTTAITTCFVNQDGTELMLSLGSGISVSGNPVLGVLLISLTAAQTALLAPIDSAILELALTLPGGGDSCKIQIPGAYSVLQSAC